MRIRSIKPEFFRDEDLSDLSAMTRLLFIGLWCMADGEGRLQNRPRRIKADIFPYDDYEVEDGLALLASNGFILIYTVGDISYIAVSNFKKHQRITGREAEAKSLIPAPGEAPRKQSGNIGETADVQEGKGREGKGEGVEALTPFESPTLPPPPEGEDTPSSQRQELLAYLRSKGCTLTMRGDDIFAEWVNAGVGYPVRWIKLVCDKAIPAPALPSDLRKLLKAKKDEYQYWRRPSSPRSGSQVSA